MSGSHITRTYNDEASIWRDAWRIADPGASNPVAVARTLFAASAFLLHEIGTDGVRKHPALRLIAAQLASLYGVNADGGGMNDDDDFISIVEREAKAQNINDLPIGPAVEDPYITFGGNDG